MVCGFGTVSQGMATLAAEASAAIRASIAKRRIAEFEKARAAAPTASAKPNPRRRQSGEACHVMMASEVIASHIRRGFTKKKVSKTKPGFCHVNSKKARRT